jgi:nitrate/nitrite transport system substrate-binding protein
VALLGAIRTSFPGGAFAQGAGPEVSKAVLGYIALMDASALVIAKEKGLFAKHGMPDVDVQKQASWGATRDNVVLGSEKNGIDGAHILTPMPYLISAGKVTQNSVPTSTPRRSRLPTSTRISRSRPTPRRSRRRSPPRKPPTRK